MADRVPGVHRAAVLGSPIAHSLSPALHRAAYAGLTLPWTYEAIDVDVAHLAGFLAGLDSTWAGLSLTMPLKEAVIPLLSEVDDEARAVRAVNTVLPAADGWWGTNTDVPGIVQALLTAGMGGQPDTATILGAGATARSAVAALARLGVREVAVCARREHAAQEVAALASSLGIAASTRDLQPVASVLAADIVISTLPGDAGAPWALLAADAPGALLDASYHPWPTPLAQAWGSPVVASGRDMLLWQAVEQVRLMTGLEPSVELMSAALPA
jgi:shikimate dehydrogenase